MGLNIRQQIAMLVKLQNIELEIRRHQQTLSRVDFRMEELDGQLKEFTDAVEKGKVRVQELSKTYRTLESELQIHQGRITRSQEKLRSVKTNKEYQLGLKEIDDLATIGSKIEDDILACLEEIDSVNAALKKDQAHLDTQSGMIRSEKEVVRQDAEKASTRLLQMEEEAAGLCARVAPEILTLYRRVQAKKSDRIGIAAVCDAVCRGCNVNIPPQMYNDLQRFDRLKNCPNCERLIYWNQEESRSE